jgi:hypothetical protein
VDPDPAPATHDGQRADNSYGLDLRSSVPQAEAVKAAHGPTARWRLGLLRVGDGGVGLSGLEGCGGGCEEERGGKF